MNRRDGVPDNLYQMFWRKTLSGHSTAMFV